MLSKDLVFRFFGIDAGAGREFDRMAAKTAASGSAWTKFAVRAGGAAAIVGAYSLKMASDFQKSTELIHTQAGVSQQGLDSMRKGILSLAGAVATSPEALSEALFHIASTGLRGAKAMDALRIAAEGAKVGNANLTDVTNALNNVLVSGIKGSSNMAHAMGSLNAIVGAGDMHMQDLAEALGTGGLLTIAKQFGVSLNQVGGALAVFGDNTIRGSQAATFLRQAIQKLSVPSATADKALSQINLSAKQLSNSLVRGGLTGALTTLHDHFVKSGLAANEWGRVLEQAFTVRAGQGISILVGQFGRYMQKVEDAKHGANNFGQAWRDTTKTFSFQFDRMRSDVAVLAIKLGNVLMPAAAKVLSAILDLGRVVGDVAGFFARNSAAAIALGSVLTAVLIPRIVMLGATMAAWAGRAFIAPLILGFSELVVAVEAADGAVATFRAILSTLDLNPVILAITAIIAASAAMWHVLGGGAEAQAHKGEASIKAYVHTLNNMHESLQVATTNVGLLVTRLASVDFGKGNIDEKAGEFEQLAQSVRSALRAQQAIKSNESSLRDAFGLTQGQVEKLAKSAGIDLAGSWEQVSSAFLQATGPTASLAADTKSLGANAQGSANEVNALTSALDRLAGNALSADQAEIAFRNNLVSLKHALDKSHGSMKLNTAAARSARDQMDSAAQSAIQWVDAQAKLKGGTDKARAALTSAIAGIKGVAGNSPYAKHAIQLLTDALNNLPSKGAGQKTGEQYVAGLAAGLGAYATVDTAAKALAQRVDRVTRITAGVHSPSKNAKKIGEWYVKGLAIGLSSHGKEIYLSASRVATLIALGLTEGFKGESLKAEHAFSQSMQTMMTNLSGKIRAGLKQQHDLLKKDTANWKADLAARVQAIGSLRDSIAGNADISNVLNQATSSTATTVDFTGSSSTIGTATTSGTTTGSIRSFLKGQASLLKQEATMFGRLRKMGLSPFLLAQISAMAPSDAISIMRQIISGADGSISSLNQYENQIRAYSKQIASADVNAQSIRHGMTYPQLLKHDRKEIHRQTELLDKIEKHLKHFRNNPASKTEIHIALKELGFTNAEIRKLMARMDKIRRESGGRVVVASK